MVAVPTNTKVIKAIVLALALAVVAIIPQINAWVGATFGTATAGIVALILLYIRELVNENGLNNGDLNNQEQVDQIQQALPEQTVPEEEEVVAPEQ